MFFFETDPSYVAQASLELEIFLPQLLNPEITGMTHHIPQEFTVFGEERAAYGKCQKGHRELRAEST